MKVGYKNYRNKSGVNGVSFDKAHNSSRKWRLLMTIDGKQRHIGWFRTKADAITAREKANDLLPE